MSPLQFLSILRARWKIAAAILILTVATTVGVSLILPKAYTSTASVLVDVRSPDPIAGMVLQGMMGSSYMGTQVDIIQSNRVALRVVKNLKLAENPSTREQWIEETGGNGDISAWVASLLTPNLTVTPSRESSLISVSYTAPDPKFAAAVANGFAQAYIDTTLDLRTDPAKRYSSFFDERADQLRKSLESAQAKLSDYQKDKGIIGNDERMDIETARLNELSSQLVTLQALSAESSSRGAQSRTSADRMQEVMRDPVVSNLQADLARQEARLQELNSRLGDAHPQVREQQASIAQVRSRLQSAMERAAASVRVAANIDRGREAEIRAALEAQRTKLLRMKGQRDELAVLQRDVENAQRAYDAVLARLNQTSLESQNTNTNLTVLAPAVPSVLPSSPRLLLNTALSVVVGLMLAIAAALLIEWVDRRVRTSEDVVELLDLPLIGVLPKPVMRRGLLRHGTKNAMIPRRVLARLPHAPARS